MARQLLKHKLESIAGGEPMWIQIGLIHAPGLAVTAGSVLRTRIFQKDPTMNTGSMILGPPYWLFLGIAQFKDRC